MFPSGGFGLTIKGICSNFESLAKRVYSSVVSSRLTL